MQKIIIVGAGLVGSVLSVFLAKKGYEVEIFEYKPDPRATKVTSSRSINLTLCERGFQSLDLIGAGEIVRKISVPAYGRLIHDVRGELTFQPYGNNREAIHSVSRNDLNKALLSFAERSSNVTFHFDEKCMAVDFVSGAVEMRNVKTGAASLHKADRIVGCDGAHSSVRLQMQKTDRFNLYQQHWRQGYKELHVPGDAANGWTARKNVLHIWPRGQYMLIGFPNIDGSFTCSLHIPFEGEQSFESLTTEADLLELFNGSFPDVVPHMPRLVEDFFTNPPNSMITIKCSPWSFKDKTVLIGDAAHAIYPSYGQGANAGFEDCAVLSSCIEERGQDWATAFLEYENRRKPDTDAIADLCVEHFVELRDLVGDPAFLLRKQIERRINQRHPDKYRDLYSMITFTCLPYATAMRIDRQQRAIVDEIMQVEGIEQKLNAGEADPLIDALMNTRADRVVTAESHKQRSKSHEHQ